MRTSRLAGALAVLLLLELCPLRPASAQQGDAELTARTRFAAGKYQEALDIYASPPPSHD